MKYLLKTEVEAFQFTGDVDALLTALGITKQSPLIIGADDRTILFTRNRTLSTGNYVIVYGPGVFEVVERFNFENRFRPKTDADAKVA